MLVTAGNDVVDALAVLLPGESGMVLDARSRYSRVSAWPVLHLSGVRGYPGMAAIRVRKSLIVK